MTFKRQKPWVVLYVLQANAPMRISYKTLIRSANKKRLFQAIKLLMTVFSSPARLMLSSEAKLMLL